MKIYILGCDNYDGLEIDGVYSSKEKALEAAPYFPYHFNDTNIIEFEIDPPNEGEKYIELWHTNIWEDGKIESRLYVQKPHLLKTTSWHGSKFRNTPFGLTAHDQTKDLAESLAREGFKRLSPVWMVWRSPHNAELAEHQYPHIEAIHEEIKDHPQLYSNEFPKGVHADINVARIALFNYEKDKTESEFLILPK